MERLTWRRARIAAARPETAQARSLWLEVPGWPGHLPGQHVQVRLTAADGYRTQRSYSVASAPSEPLVRLTVERLPAGEVSPYLTDVAQVGDPLEIRGPLGEYFVWDGRTGPLLLLAGGSGVIPLFAMLRHRAADPGAQPVRARLLYSCRTAADALYQEELRALTSADPDLRVYLTLTRAGPEDRALLRRRVDTAMLAQCAWPPADQPHMFICGPDGFVQAAAEALLELGHPAERIRTERFGPSGG